MKTQKNIKSGILVVDKVEGVSSHNLVARTRRTLGIKKVGHAGTLDPFATGVMILLVGEGTKLSNYLMEGEKTYLATMVLGERRSTADLTGEVLETLPVPELDESSLIRTLEGFKGTSKQIPPMYSAIKKDGLPLYKYARKGIELERSEREIFIRHIQLKGFDGQELIFEVSCSKGTYVRTLAEDVASALGTCGYLKSLRRVANGDFTLENALTTEELDDREKILSSMIPLGNSLHNMTAIEVKEEAVEKILNGRHLIAGWLKGFEKKEGKQDRVKFLSPQGTLLSIGELTFPLSAIGDLPEKSVIGKSLRVFNNV